MLDQLTDWMHTVIERLPIIALILPYVGISALMVLIGVIYLELGVDNPVKGVINKITSKVILGLCIIALVIWVIFTVVFVFPFHCLKNWDQVRLIRDNKRLKRDKVSR